MPLKYRTSLWSLNTGWNLWTEFNFSNVKNWTNSIFGTFETVKKKLFDIFKSTKIGILPMFDIWNIEFSPLVIWKAASAGSIITPILIFCLFPIVRWTREGTKFRDGSYTVIGDLTLPLVNVTMEDGGKYFCTATSSKGNFTGCTLCSKIWKKCNVFE